MTRPADLMKASDDGPLTAVLAGFTGCGVESKLVDGSL